jgi:hypothetical protein
MKAFVARGRALHARRRSGAARPQCDGANDGDGIMTTPDCRWGDAGFLVAICAAIWLFFYYVPAHGEEPKIEDSWWYDFCVPIRDGDREWFMKELDKREIKSFGTKCGTLRGVDLRWFVDELRKRGYDVHWK